MKKLPRITEIIKIEPYKITCRWTTGEIRVIDFVTKYKDWKDSGNEILLKLKDYSKFENVTIKDGTLQWYSVEISFTGIDGTKKTQALDIDPDVLYKQSKSISSYKLVLETV